MEILRIPTEKEGVILKTVTKLDDQACLLSVRQYKHPLPPQHREAPDHHRYRALRKKWNDAPPESVNTGIWDTQSFRNIAFIGYASLTPVKFEVPAAEIGVEILELYQRRGYGSLAVKALAKYGREALGYEAATADILSRNGASRSMVENLGFVCYKELRGHAYYFKDLADETSDASSQPTMSDAR